MLNNAPNNSKYKQGNYIPENKEKVIAFNSLGGIFYRSSWEKRLLIYFDHNDKIYRYGSEFLAIEYEKTSVKDGNMVTSKHRYYPDFYYELKRDDGSISKVVAEVKPLAECYPPKPPKNAGKKQLENYKYAVDMYNKNMFKWEQAIKFCEARDIKFVIITEDYLNKLQATK